MLYDTVGPALLATLRPDQFQATHDITVHFLRPVRPGRMVGKGRVVRRDGDLAHVEASLIRDDGETAATATATATVIPLDQASDIGERTIVPLSHPWPGVTAVRLMGFWCGCSA
jgi:Thioesterase superfamily